MSRTAKEEWDLLNKAVNCKHYIGPNRWKVINDALSVPEVVHTPKPVVKAAPRVIQKVSK